MTPEQIALAVAAALGIAALAAARPWRWVLVTAAPDEWLLRIRQGRLVEAGVGITVWRSPREVVAKFSSTMQRVGFTLEALTAERLKVSIDGFVLWSVAAGGERPFVAFRTLGLANLLSPPADLKHPKHLLTTPQHRALQQLVVGWVQRHAGTLLLDDLLGDQDGFVEGLTGKLRAVLEPMGAALSQVQVLQIRPADAALLKDLSVSEEERIRAEAAQVRLESAGRIQQRERELATAQAREEANARRDRQAHEAQASLELEQHRSRILDEQRTVRLRQLEIEAAIHLHELELEHARQMAAEAQALAVQEARHRREAAELELAGQKLRRTAEAQRDAALLALEVEERKPQSVRDHELGRLSTEKLSQALKITDAKWISVGSNSPVASLGAALAEMRELWTSRRGAA
jgi:flotillin